MLTTSRRLHHYRAHNHHTGRSGLTDRQVRQAERMASRRGEDGGLELRSHREERDALRRYRRRWFGANPTDVVTYTIVPIDRQEPDHG